jgi:uncharacterized protein YjbI with pentapeptide repeats
LNENNANKCGICGRPAWGDEAEREWFNPNTGERETIRARFCIYHHPDHEKKAEEFWKTFLANFNSERSEANPFGLLEREEDNLFHNFSQFIFPKFFGSIKWEGRPFISANFFLAKFQGEANFSEVQFQGKANFWKAKFQGWANFSEAQFQGGAYFSWAQFQEGADFSEVQFQGKANFQWAQFQGGASFSGAQFQEGANFLGAKFQEGASFLEAEFQGEVSFWRAQFQGKANFREAKIFSEILFKDTLFSDLVDFRGAELSEHGDKSRQKIYGRLIFEGIEITDPAKLVLMGISNPDPEHCGIAFWLTRTPIVRGAEIRGTTLFDERGRMVALEEYAERVLEKDKKGLENLPEEERRRREREIERRNRDLRLQSYRAVRLNLEDEGMFPEAGELYVREMSIKGDDKPLLRCFLLPWDLVKNFFKKMFKRSKIKNDKELGGCGYKVLLLAYRCLSKYGESWLRPLGWLLLVLILFSVVYMFTGFEGMEYSYSLFSKYGIISFQGLLRDFSWALIYSFKSLIPGFGQLSPRSTSAWTAALTVVEGVLGAVIITLLLLAIRRRFRR